MRVAILAPASAPSRRPCAWDAWNGVVDVLARGLVDAGIECTVFPQNSEEPAQQDAAPHRPPILEVAAAFERAGEFDLIHNHHGAEALTYSRLVTAPMVTTVFERPEPQERALYLAYHDRSRLIAPGSGCLNDDVGYSAVIPPGLDTGTYEFIEEPEDYLVFAGRIDRQNGADRAIALARRIGHPLVLTGPAADTSFFHKEVLPQLEDGLVRHERPEDPPSRKRLLAGARTFLLTAHAPEPFPLYALEAMAGGAPILALGHGDAQAESELVEHGVTGLTAGNEDDAAEAVAAVSELDRTACRTLVEERFPPERMISAYARLYEDVIALRGRVDRRPWGHYEVLEDHPRHKVKRIMVDAGRRLSLQRHRRRSEHWVILEGAAEVTRDGEVIALETGDSVDIPAGAAHRIGNPGTTPLAFIEVQRGDYFGEDDIERLEDDFGRA